MMEVKLENGMIVIRMPISDPPVASGSGKSLVLASTRGNVKTTTVYKGKPITVGINAYVANGGH